MMVLTGVKDVMSTFAVVTRNHISARNVTLLFAVGSARICTIVDTMDCIGKYGNTKCN